MLNLKEIRIKKGLMQKDVAKLSNITPSFYCLIEKGERKPSLETAKSIADALGVSLDEFYEVIVFTLNQANPTDK